MVAIIDYGMGNIRSVANAIDLYGFEYKVISKPEQVTDFDRLIIPGVGSYFLCSQNIHKSGFADFIKEFAAFGKPILGICLGMQILSTTGFEAGESKGLNLIPGKVREFDIDREKFKIPHVGWNNVHFANEIHPLFKGIKNNSDFYFTHSYHFTPGAKENILTTTNYGIDFVSAVISKNVVGTQFHPEKSQNVGLRLLTNFLTWTP